MYWGDKAQKAFIATLISVTAALLFSGVALKASRYLREYRPSVVGKTEPAVKLSCRWGRNDTLASYRRLRIRHATHTYSAFALDHERVYK